MKEPSGLRGPAAVEETATFYPLQENKPRQAQSEFTHALRQRDRNRHVRRQSEHLAEQNESAFEGAERSRHHESGGAHAGGQTFEDEGVDEAERIAEEVKRQPDLAGADRPANKPQKTGVQQRRAAAVHGDDRLVGSLGAARKFHQRLRRSKAMSEPYDGSEQAAMLSENERRDQRRQHGDADEHRIRGFERLVSARPYDEQSDSGDDEYKLSRDADRRINDHCGGRFRARHAPLADQSRTDEIAANAGDGQKRIDRFANPAHPEDRRDAGSARGGQQCAPGERAERERNNMKQGYRREAPSEDEHDPADVSDPARRDEKDKKQEPEKTGDYDRDANDCAPSRRPVGDRGQKGNKSMTPQRPSQSRRTAPNCRRPTRHA